MNLQLPRRLLVTALLAIGAVSSAQAANYVEIDGTNVKFFYDTDFWGVGAATVTGNSISFAISDDFAVFGKTNSSTGVGAAIHVDQALSGVIAVAKTGYSVSSAVSASGKASYSFTTGAGVAQSQVGASIYGGYYTGSSFTSQSYEGSFSESAQVNSTGQASDGVFTVNAAAGSASNYFSAVGLNTQIGIAAQQSTKGRTDAILTAVSYNFAVAAVPEPETYAMMIAGLGLVGFAARRRKTAA